MNLSVQLAKHFRDVHFGGNWTSVNLKDSLEGVSWLQASTQVNSLNTILKLVYHIHYYVHNVLAVLKGGQLEAHDKFSFDHPAIQSDQDWQNFLGTVWQEAEEFASLVEQLPETKWNESFSEEKYGTYLRNILGIIEHTHYHLGQIVIIKKLL